MAGPTARSETGHPLQPTSEGMAPITVFIVDDHDVVRKGLRFYLSARPEVAIVGAAGDAQSAVNGVIEHVPDVVLMDLVLPLQPGVDSSDQGGVQATRRIRAQERGRARGLEATLADLRPKRSEEGPEE